jgi:membrane-associated protease RseP (regulator of RpoE activity)
LAVEVNPVERLLPEVRRVMEVREMTSGGSADPFRARFRGRLLVPSDQAYERLAPAFAREGLVLLLRNDGDSHAVIGVRDLRPASPSRGWLNLLFFALTGLSVLFAGISYGAGYIGVDPRMSTREILSGSLPLGLVYTLSLLGILVAHEFGHYFVGRYHGTEVTLPFFLPFPGSLFGTLGAFIRLKSPPRNRRTLMDIGLAGPVAGLVVAIPVLLIGLALSEVGPLPVQPREVAGTILEGNSLFYLAIKYLVKGELLPSPADYGGLPPLLYWIRYILTGLPAPVGGRDVSLHPMAWAGWAGLLVTGLNLVPVGQLDGGHALYALLGRRAARLWPFVLVGMAALTLVWPGWFLFAGLVFLFGRAHAQPLDDVTPLDGTRRAVAVLGLVLFLLVFTPVPLRPLGG